MPLTAGTKLGPYEIQSPLGAGGMGEVYRARDTRLDRTVAIKILPSSLSDNSDAKQRFEREARVISSLSHPNICHLYDIGNQDGTDFLVMEFLEGETLADRLSRGALPLEQVLKIGAEICDGLERAHRNGVIHRDLKPGNIMLTKSGAKLMDFGLAKAVVPAQASGLTATFTSPAAGHPLTTQGTVMGTFQYMSPEQIEGKEADARSDIFSLGCVLYEMITGKRAFEGKSQISVMSAILEKDPEPISVTQPLTPLALEHTVKTSLAKDPDERFQTAHDVKLQLKFISQSNSAITPASGSVRVPLSRQHKGERIFSFSISLLLAGSLAFFAIQYARHSSDAGGAMQFGIPVPGEVTHLALSADGSMLAFVSPDESSGLPVLYVQRIGSSEATKIPGTEGASYPFLSPDGSAVAFFANGKLQKVATSGGEPQVLASVLAARGGNWGRKGVILYTPDAGSEIWRVNADGTGIAPVTKELRTQEQSTQRWPIFLPDGEHFLFWGGNFVNAINDKTSGIYISSLGDNNKAKLVIPTHSSFAYSSGRLFYVAADRHLVTVPFDPSTGTISGSTTTISDVIGFQPSTYWASVAAAENGTLVYNTHAGAALSVLTWLDRNGKELSRVGNPAVIANPTISPDGNRIAVDVSDPKANNVDVWLANATGNTRFTFDPAEEVVGVWSRDGSKVAYRANVVSGTALLVKAASGLEREKVVVNGPIYDDIFPNSWTSDDRQILCTYQNPDGSHLVLVSAAGGDVTPVLPGKGNQTNGQISRDGKWLAYASDESSQWEVYVTTFPGAVGKWQVSRGGGTEPRWRGDGKEIFYLGPGGILTSVSVNGQGTFSTGQPVLLFQFHGRAPISSTDTFSYDVSGDGSRFLVNRYLKPDHVDPLTIVLHATADGQK